MRTLLYILLLMPSLATATTYKCVVDGQTTYSQEPCGANAEEFQAKKKLSGVGTPTPVSGGQRSEESAPTRNGRPGSAEDGGHKPPAGQDSGDSQSCSARMKAYQDALACFEPYRHGTVIDTEAYKHCPSMSEPTDCMGSPSP